MTPEARHKLRTLLIQDESYRQFPYVDTTGHLTIGIGRNLKDRGISLDEALYLLDNDMPYFSTKLADSLDFWYRLNDARQIVLVVMCFNLGLQGLLNFTEMMKCLLADDYEGASKEMLDSKWATQVKNRAIRLAEIMKTGVL